MTYVLSIALVQQDARIFAGAADPVQNSVELEVASVGCQVC